MTKPKPKDQLLRTPRTKERLLEQAEKNNVPLPDEYHSFNDIAVARKKILNNPKPRNLNETRGGFREGAVIPASKPLESIKDSKFNQELLQHAFKYWKVPTAKTDEEIADRIEFYFSDCYNAGVRPTLEGCALAIGVTAETFKRWADGESKSELDRHELSKRVRTVLAYFDAELFMNGKLNPVAYIFRSKNFYGMKDQVETIVKKDDPLGETKTESEIMKVIDADVVEES